MATSEWDTFEEFAEAQDVETVELYNKGSENIFGNEMVSIGMKNSGID